MKIKNVFLIFAILPLLALSCLDNNVTPDNGFTPPFTGTIFLDPDIINDTDPSTFSSISPNGQDTRTMYDRRSNDFITLKPYLFNAVFNDSLKTEIQVNPEFGSVQNALEEATKYAQFIGKIPTALRKKVETVWIHRGIFPFGGGNKNLLIHTGQAEIYINDGILEETFIHEATHTSLDEIHGATAGWLSAQSADQGFISLYARDFPTREDLAESFLPYLAVKYKADRISKTVADAINLSIPNRMKYFDAQNFDMHPIVK